MAEFVTGRHGRLTIGRQVTNLPHKVTRLILEYLVLHLFAIFAPIAVVARPK